MRDPNRIALVLKEIEKIWIKYPDMRLGQLICNVIRSDMLYCIEDDILLKGLDLGYNSHPELRN